MFFAKSKPVDALPKGTAHFVNGNAMHGPYPDGFGQVQFAMGCFWGVEQIFWRLPGVWVTSVGYAGGEVTDPDYEQVCSGKTGHTEAVHVVFDPAIITLRDLLTTFWEGHDPTQGNRQGNDRGSQYRSAIYVYSDADLALTVQSAAEFQPQLTRAGYGLITTEMRAAPTYYFAEEYHQQYLAKNPAGYCGIGGTGVTCPIGLPS
ncbi:MAG: peptide-methionine (S)-S-oxide reductase MsrA [Rhodobacteraceae bacterium]|nr:peptide-methionine (S)-S-oxide reductase MsrA [Paracoccaceae bacterium]